MRIAIMQPYIFPYLGYFQLIAAVDKFVLFDSVHYINKGWINRNRLLVNNQAVYFTVPLRKASQNRLIKDLEISYAIKWQIKLLRTIEVSYTKAPYFKRVFPMVYKVLTSNETHISGLVYSGLLHVLEYLGIHTKIISTSAKYGNEHLRAQNTIIDICLQEQASEYVNLVGGASLYQAALFEQYGVRLLFLEPGLPVYQQFSSDHVPGLSILDVLMHNSPEQISQMLLQYRLI
ncbi:WbqC family protein [Hymenobacter volaticus]|uniref:WbqC family protein n=1 Tax=Hymenobacter volaticus TaxID=2932254 RepID=A0ABY4GA10_9BACT|nr:WbqC family protein [Hymenobacter volaticus]UOQ67738.1 WbqC family protein [Hymenobacter volaticus]